LHDDIDGPYKRFFHSMENVWTCQQCT